MHLSLALLHWGLLFARPQHVAISQSMRQVAISQSSYPGAAASAANQLEYDWISFSLAAHAGHSASPVVNSDPRLSPAALAFCTKSRCFLAWL